MPRRVHVAGRATGALRRATQAGAAAAAAAAAAPAAAAAAPDAAGLGGRAPPLRRRERRRRPRRPHRIGRHDQSGWLAGRGCKVRLRPHSADEAHTCVDESFAILVLHKKATANHVEEGSNNEATALQ